MRMKMAICTYYALSLKQTFALVVDKLAFLASVHPFDKEQPDLCATAAAAAAPSVLFVGMNAPEEVAAAAAPL